MSGRSQIVIRPSCLTIFWSSSGPFSTYSLVCASSRASQRNPAAVSPVCFNPRSMIIPHTARIVPAARGPRMGPRRAEPVVHRLRAHVEPADVHVGVQVFKPVLEQGEQVAAVGGVDDERRAAVALAGGSEQGEDGAKDEPLRIADCGLRN